MLRRRGLEFVPAAAVVGAPHSSPTSQPPAHRSGVHFASLTDKWHSMSTIQCRSAFYPATYQDDFPSRHLSCSLIPYHRHWYLWSISQPAARTVLESARARSHTSGEEKKTPEQKNHSLIGPPCSTCSSFGWVQQRHLPSGRHLGVALR